MKIWLFAVEFAELARTERVYDLVMCHCLKVGAMSRKNKGRGVHFGVDGRGNVESGA